MKHFLAVCVSLMIAAGAYGQNGVVKKILFRNNAITTRTDTLYYSLYCNGDIKFHLKMDSTNLTLVDTASTGFLTWQIDGINQPAATDHWIWTAHLELGIHTIALNLKQKDGTIRNITFQFFARRDVQTTLTDSICQGESYMNNGFEIPDTLLPGRFTYVWQGKTAMKCDSIVTLILTVNPIFQTHLVMDTVTVISGEMYHGHSEAGDYPDTLQTVHGCDSIFYVHVSVTVIPNTFTPNSDGINDIFMQGHHVQVYTRNGVLAYDGTNGWDGTYRGKPVSNGTYFYVIYYQSINGIKTRNGYVMVAR